MTAPVAVNPEKSAARAIPKSATFIVPSGANKTFLGFGASVDLDSCVVGGLQAPTDLMSDIDGPLNRESALYFAYVVEAFG